MIPKVDVAIIGAGPGGGMAACRLAQSGLRVLILEKAVLPRHKPCGGGIPSAAKQFFDWDFSSLVEQEIFGARYLYNYELPRTISFSDPILMVDRSRFDHALIERAIALGRGAVELRDGLGVSRIEEDASGVSLWTENGECVRADFVVAADGAFSKTARALGLKRKAPLAVAIDAEIEVDAEIYEREKECATFNFNCLPNGYGWIFPKNGILSCGVGSWGGRPRLVEAMDDFLERTFPAGSIQSIKRFGHPLPLYAGHSQIATPRVCLVGDAANLVDPIMGEGIRFALQSGALAAEVIGQVSRATLSPRPSENPASQDLASTDAMDCRAYQPLIQQGLGAGFDLLFGLISPIFFKQPEFFYRKFFYEGQNYFNLAHQIGGLLAQGTAS